MKRQIGLLLMLLSLFLGGCATSRSVLDVNVPATTEASPRNGKEVYINSVTDKRIFEVSPKTPSIPSLDPSEESNPDVTLRAVGRKRNGYGKALGDILLKDGETVETLLAASMRKAFAESGYKILNDRSQATADTYIVDGSIEKFWTWINMGFWQLTVSTEIATTVTIAAQENGDVKEYQVAAQSQYPTMAVFDGTYIQCIEDALLSYVNELKRQIQ